MPVVGVGLAGPAAGEAEALENLPQDWFRYDPSECADHLLAEQEQKENHQ